MEVNLTDAQREQLRQVFENALSVPPGQRNVFVGIASDGDKILETELLSLLDAHDRSDGYFEMLAENLIAPALEAMDPLEASEPSLTGRSVSHYEIQERIGRGGMGVVYKARDTRLGRDVALKFLPRHHASSSTARSLLLAEARATSRLDHPNIGVVHEIGEDDDGRQFIAMAWYDGETLKDRIGRSPVSIDEAIAIASQLGAALAEAHREGIIHRDVKPSNVLITRSGGLKLVDFGIAQLINDADGERQEFAGTLPYMSPEQTEELPLDARTDIWSLGVVLYETLTGQRPFRGDSGEQVTSAIQSGKQTSIVSVRGDIPPALELVIDRCLKKNRDLRFQTAVEFCEMLKPLAHPPGLMRKHRRALTATLLTMFAVAVAATWPYWRSAYVNRAAMLEPVRSIVVLPFAQVSGGADNAYLTDALAEDIRGDLSWMRPITVSSFLSSASYEGTSKSMGQIARETGANYLIAGSVRSSAGSDTLELHIVDASKGAVKLSKRYVASPQNADIVREATRDIVTALDLTLTDKQASELRHNRTTNARAYDLYLRGLNAELSGLPRAAFGTPSRQSIRAAQGFYVQAKTLDAAFAVVRGRLANSHIASATAYDTTRSRLDEARAEAEAALRLGPSLPHPHVALSAYWIRVGEPEKSIAEVILGLESTPNDVGLHIALAGRYFEAGRGEDGLAEFETAVRLDPRNPVAAAGMATSYGRLRRNAEALKAFNRFIEISPNDNEVRLIKGHFYLKWKGTPDTLIAELQKIPENWDDGGMASFAWYTAMRMKRNYQAGLAALGKSKTSLSNDGFVYYPKSLMLADMYYGLGETGKATSHYQLARSEMTDSAAAHPGDANIHAALALANAGLGRKSDAIAEAERAISFARSSGNREFSAATMGKAVEVFGRVGKFDRAFETIELLFAMSAGREATIRYLQVWPGFDALRKDPRFDELLTRFTITR